MSFRNFMTGKSHSFGGSYREVLHCERLASNSDVGPCSVSSEEVIVLSGRDDMAALVHTSPEIGSSSPQVRC
jgi:hypothetical protein